MYSKSFVKRAGAAALSLVMAASLLPWAKAAPPVVDESYYGTLDYYGALTEGSVVKSYRLNGNTDLADVGAYSEVNNLTDRTEPTVEGDRVTFHLTDDSLKNFYFEGKTDKPFEEMPFRIHISYKMNGVETDPEDMAGQTGLAEITLDVEPNPLASAYQRNNFALEAAAMCKDSDLLSIEAPGGQLQKVGDLDAVLYLVLPGETRSFTLRIGSEDFSFPGFTFLVQPATLAQLDQIKELKDAKEDLEDSARDISDSLEQILDSLDGMDSNLRKTADGLDQLNRARATISAGKGRVYDEADRTLASMTDLTEALKPAVEHIKTAKDALAEASAQLIVLTETTDGLRPELQAVRTDLENLQGDMNDLHGTLTLLKADGLTAGEQLGILSGDLGDLTGHLDTFQTDMQGIETNLGTLSGDLDRMDSDLDVLRSDLQAVSNRTGDLRRSSDSLDRVDIKLDPIDAIPFGGKSYTSTDINQAKIQMDGDPELGTPGIYDICVALGYNDDDNLLLADKELALTRFIMENAQDITMAIIQNDPERKASFEAGVAQAVEQGAAQNAPAAAEQTATAKMAEIAPGLTPDNPAWQPTYESVLQAVLADPEFQAQVRAQVTDKVMEEAMKQATEQSGMAKESQAQTLSLLHYQWDEGLDVEDQLVNLDSLNETISKGNRSIDNLNRNLDSLTGSSSDLLSSLEVLLGDIDSSTIPLAQDLLDDSRSLLDNSQSALSHTRDAMDTLRTGSGDAQDLLSTARTLIDHLTSYDMDALNDHANRFADTGKRSAEQLDKVLEETTKLSETVTKYEPDAQAALDSAAGQLNASVTLLQNMNTFGKSMESLMQAAGPDLDQGTDATLSGLSSTLRQASDSGKSITTIRKAKDTVTKLVEDKWDEFTGEKSNLLNMDANAEKVSLTSPENPAPNTIQIVLRSQEIKVDEEAKKDARHPEQEKLNFWGRVGRMFHDFGAIFTGD